MSSFTTEDNFFDSEMLGAIQEMEAEIIPLGTHRFKPVRATPECYADGNGVPHKRLVFWGHNADTGREMLVRFKLTDKSGQPNRFALRDLSTSLLSSGITTPLPKLEAMTQFPVVTLNVVEETYTTGQGKDSTVTKMSFSKCDNQSSVAGKAKPQPEAQTAPPAANEEEGVEDVTPF